jgi:hypothetical protein
LPIAIVADRSGDKVSAIRVYHSTWPFTGKHLVRPPLLKPAENLDEPVIVKHYTAALRKGDADSALSLFEDKGLCVNRAAQSINTAAWMVKKSSMSRLLKLAVFHLNTVRLLSTALALLWNIFVTDGGI